MSALKKCKLPVLGSLSAPASICRHELRHDRLTSSSRWARLQVPYFPPAQSIADFSPEKCEELLLAAIGDPGIDIDLRSVRTWTMHAEVADNFQVGPGILRQWLVCRTKCFTSSACLTANARAISSLWSSMASRNGPE